MFSNEEKDFEHTNCSKIVITKQTNKKTKHRALVESIIKQIKSLENPFLTKKKKELKMHLLQFQEEF